MTGAQSPPRTIMEAYKMLPYGTLADVIEGILFIARVPFIEHQRTVAKWTVAK